MLHRAQWRYQRMEDLAGFVALHILLSSGAKFPRPGAPQPPPDPTTPTFERLMGRPPVPFFDPVPPSEEQQAEDDERKRVAAERLARAQMQVWEATMRRAHPEKIVDDPDDEEPEPSPPA